MHGSVLARAQESARDPVVVRKPASGLLGTAAQASGDVSRDAVTVWHPADPPPAGTARPL